MEEILVSRNAKDLNQAQGYQTIELLFSLIETNAFTTFSDRLLDGHFRWYRIYKTIKNQQHTWNS